MDSRTTSSTVEQSGNDSSAPHPLNRPASWFCRRFGLRQAFLLVTLFCLSCATFRHVPFERLPTTLADAGVYRVTTKGGWWVQAGTGYRGWYFAPAACGIYSNDSWNWYWGELPPDGDVDCISSYYLDPWLIGRQHRLDQSWTGYGCWATEPIPALSEQRKRQIDSFWDLESAANAPSFVDALTFTDCSRASASTANSGPTE